MAIDTAAKRRNVGRMLTPCLFLGLAPIGTVDTAQRVNAGLGYIGIEYGDAVDATPENIDLDTPITVNIDLETAVS